MDDTARLFAQYNDPKRGYAKTFTTLAGNGLIQNNRFSMFVRVADVEGPPPPNSSHVQLGEIRGHSVYYPPGLQTSQLTANPIPVHDHLAWQQYPLPGMSQTTMPASHDCYHSSSIVNAQNQVGSYLYTQPPRTLPIGNMHHQHAQPVGRAHVSTAQHELRRGVSDSQALYSLQPPPDQVVYSVQPLSNQQYYQQPACPMQSVMGRCASAHVRSVTMSDGQLPSSSAVSLQPSAVQPIESINHSMARGGEKGMTARATVLGGASFRPAPKGGTSSVKRSLVILQGGFTQADVSLLEQSLTKMGFTESPHWKPNEPFSKQELEILFGRFVDGLSPGSNLLLIIASLNLRGIALEEKFLMEAIYNKVARDNITFGQHREERERNSEDTVFDSRSYEGVTLHVVLDGVPGCVLPQTLCFEPEKGDESKGLRSTWVRVPKGTTDYDELLPMKYGRIVQICSNMQRSGHRAGTLLSAFVCMVLDEAYVPYNVMAYKILGLMDHYFKKTYEQEDERNMSERMPGCYTARMGGEIAMMSFQATMALYMNYKKQTLKRAKERVATMLAHGDMFLVSANKFDPNLCLDVDWKEDDLPFTNFVSS